MGHSPIVMIHSFLWNTLLSSDTAFGLTLNFSVYKIEITCICSIYSLANCHGYSKIRKYRKNVANKMNGRMLTHGHGKNNDVGFSIKERMVRKPEERSCFISVVIGAESDTFTDPYTN